MFNKQDFLKVNGYSNDYWGWGPEDLELGIRCKIVGLDFDKRDGTFMALPHKHRGFNADRNWTEESTETHRLFQDKIKNLHHAYVDDGLNTLKFELMNTEKFTVDGKIIDNIYNKSSFIHFQPFFYYCFNKFLKCSNTCSISIDEMFICCNFF